MAQAESIGLIGEASKTARRVVAITGGSSGIGLALAEAYAAQGCAVAIMARSLVGLEKAAAHLQAKFAAEVLVYVGDVAFETNCIQFYESIMVRFGRADILICNAGLTMRATVADADTAVLERLMQVNYLGAVYCSKAFLPALLAANGWLVAIGSVAAHRGLPARSGYSASKAALLAYMEALRTEMLDAPIQILTVSPGYTASGIRQRALLANGQVQGQSPMEERKMMPASQVARAVVEAIAHGRRHIIVGRQAWFIVWLNRLFPAWMDRRVQAFYARVSVKS